MIVAPDRRGFRRVGTISSALALDLVFHREGAHKVVGCVAVDHTASLVMSERLGYRREGRLRQHVLRREGSIDLWAMGLLRSDWVYREHLDAGADPAELLRTDRERA